MNWWCFAQPGTAWTWQWQPLIGVWLVMVLLIWGYQRLLSRTDDSHEPSRLRKSRRVAFALAIFLLWASLDWPLGPLGASYLASVHMVQFLVVVAAIGVPGDGAVGNALCIRHTMSSRVSNGHAEYSANAHLAKLVNVWELSRKLSWELFWEL